MSRRRSRFLELSAVMPFHPDHPHADARAAARNGGVGGGGGGVGGGRLNLLLSWGGWSTDSWADRLPTLLSPMGVACVRATTAREAERAIRSVPVHIAVVDLGLPMDGGSSGGQATGEEGGARILELLRRLESPPPTVVVKSPRAAAEARRDMAAALRCDAFAVVDRTGADLEVMLKVLHRCFDRFYHGRWPNSTD
jgi:hypothetical protein